MEPVYRFRIEYIGNDGRIISPTNNYLEGYPSVNLGVIDVYKNDSEYPEEINLESLEVYMEIRTKRLKSTDIILDILKSCHFPMNIITDDDILKIATNNSDLFYDMNYEYEKVDKEQWKKSIWRSEE